MALKDGTCLETACQQMQLACEAVLGYDQPCEIKKAELPPYVTAPPQLPRGPLEAALNGTVER